MSLISFILRFFGKTQVIDGTAKKDIELKEEKSDDFESGCPRTATGRQFKHEESVKTDLIRGRFNPGSCESHRERW